MGCSIHSATVLSRYTVASLGLQWLSRLQQYKLLVATAVAVGCSIRSATILSRYTVVHCMVAVVVKVATVLLSGCNSSCSGLQHNIGSTQCHWYTVASCMVAVVVRVVTVQVTGCNTGCGGPVVACNS